MEHGIKWVGRFRGVDGVVETRPRESIPEVSCPTAAKKVRARTLRLMQGPNSVKKRKATRKKYLDSILAAENADEKKSRLEKEKSKYAVRMFLESDMKRAARNAKLVKRYSDKKNINYQECVAIE